MDKRNEEVLKKLNMALFALNQITVREKPNLLNLGGAIDIVESVIADLSGNVEEETKD